MSVVDRPPDSRYWAECYYPWLENGYVLCTCGTWFHSSERNGTASAQHAEHMDAVYEIAPGHPGPARR